MKFIRDGVFELRTEYNNNIYRVFFIFDDGNIVVWFNGFQKKSQKTPGHEIDKAVKIKEEYYEYKKQHADWYQAEEKAYAFYTGQIIEDARKKARITQAELARRIGSDRSYISRVESGQTEPKVSTFYRIMNALGCKIEFSMIL